MNGPVLLHRACATFHVLASAAFHVGACYGARGALGWAFLCAFLAAVHVVRGELLARKVSP